MLIFICSDKKEGTIGYAAGELKRYLGRFTDCTFAEDRCRDADLTFSLACRSDMQEHRYAVRKEGNIIHHTGGSESAVLCSVYEMLMRCGVCFDTSGQWLSGPFDLSALDGIDETIVPLCRYRGIRQHINFPMDISSYPLADAKKYIRSLASMRFNAITFHSYPGTWYSYAENGETVLAGNFFYGQKHIIPGKRSFASAVSNRSVFCIPEAEGIMDDAHKRSDYARYWLREVISEAKLVGMKVTYSVEFRSEREETRIQILRNIVSWYPEIDVLELISGEGGGIAGGYSIENVSEKAAALFGDDILRCGRLPYLPDDLPEALPGSLEFLYKCRKLLDRRDMLFGELEKTPEIRVGLYVMCRDTLRVMRPLMNKVLPADVGRSFLPAHGASAVAGNIKYMRPDASDWKNTMYYSWAEFDGLMYIQQMSLEGICTLSGMAAAAGDTVYGICLNHWRTEENRTAISYAARTLISHTDVITFCRSHAAELGIAERDTFCKALLGMAKLDGYNRDNLFNVAFCYLGCWLGTKGLGWIRGWKTESLDHSIDKYSELRDMFAVCLSGTLKEEGTAYLRFIMNRISCSILHLKLIHELNALCVFTDDRHPELLTCEQRTEVKRHCSKAAAYADEYMALHSELIPDRGCEGTMISYYATMPVYIDHIRAYFTEGETVCRHDPPTWDAPPPPDAAAAGMQQEVI
jgi:hypothetical protein